MAGSGDGSSGGKRQTHGYQTASDLAARPRILRQVNVAALFSKLSQAFIRHIKK